MQSLQLINESQACSICYETGNWEPGYFYDLRAASHLHLAPDRICSPLSQFLDPPQLCRSEINATFV